MKFSCVNTNARYKENKHNYIRYTYLHTWRDSHLFSQNRKVTVVLEGFLLLINNIAWPPCTSDGHTTMRERSNMGSIATKLPLITRPEQKHRDKKQRQQWIHDKSVDTRRPFFFNFGFTAKHNSTKLDSTTREAPQTTKLKKTIGWVI